jgi:hypothetical protein
MRKSLNNLFSIIDPVMFCRMRVPLLFIIFFLAQIFSAKAATYYSRQTGTFATANTWSTSPTGTPVNGTAIANGDIFIIQATHVVTVGAARTIAQVTINSGGTLGLATFLLTVTNAWINNGTITGSTGRLGTTTSDLTNNGVINLSGAGGFVKTTGDLTNTANGTITIVGAGTVTMGTGDFINLNTTASCDFGSSIITITGTAAAQTIGGFTTNARLACTKTSGVVTLTGNIDVIGITVTAGTLNLGSGLTHTTSGPVQTVAGTLNGGLLTTLNVTPVSVVAWSGAGASFTASTGTVNFGAAGAQTISASGTKTFNNLNFSGSGIKTNTGIAVNGTLTMEGTATVSAVPAYGGSAGLVYSSTTAKNAGVEWPAQFTSTGGIVVESGTITITANKLFQANSPLAINNNGKLATGNFDLVLRDDLINNGTWISSTGDITVNGTTGQSIGTFSTTGALISTKLSGGVATLTGDVRVGSITVSQTGTLNLGAGLSHDVSGAVALSGGLLYGGSSTLDVAGNWTGTGTLFQGGTGTIRFRSAAQTLSATGAKTFYNLVYAGGGAKNTSAGTTVINNILSMEEAGTASGTTVSYGASGGLQYNTTVGRNIGVEWLTPFAGGGGVTISSTGIITMTADKILSAGAAFTIKPTATFNAGAFTMTFNDDFINDGTWTNNSGHIVLAGTAAQNIGAFTTTGIFKMQKTGGVATMQGNASSNGFFLSGIGGTLSLGTGLAHTFNGTYTNTAGTVNGGTSTMNLGLDVASSGGTFNPETGTVNFTAAVPVAVPPVIWYNVGFSGAGLKVMVGEGGANNVMTIQTGATVDMGAFTFVLSGPGTPLVVTGGGTMMASSSVIGFTNAGSVNVPALDYYSLYTAGGPRVFASGATTRIAGTFTPGTGPHTITGSIIDFNSTVDQVIPAFTFDKLIVSNNGIKRILATMVVGCQTIDVNDNASVEINADGAGKLNIMGP